MSDPTKPWYIIRSRRDDEDSVRVTQESPPKPEQWDPADVVPPEWPAANRCRKKKAHRPHTWGGEGYSNFRCEGNAE